MAFKLGNKPLPGIAREGNVNKKHKFKVERKNLADGILGEANMEGKRLVLMFEQRGCIYCSKMHKDVYSRDNVSNYRGKKFKDNEFFYDYLKKEINPKGIHLDIAHGFY